MTKPVSLSLGIPGPCKFAVCVFYLKFAWRAALLWVLASLLLVHRREVKSQGAVLTKEGWFVKRGRCRRKLSFSGSISGVSSASHRDSTTSALGDQCPRRALVPDFPKVHVPDGQCLVAMFLLPA